MKRYVYAVAGSKTLEDKTYRLGLDVNGTEFPAGKIVEIARDTATNHVLALMSAADLGQL